MASATCLSLLAQCVGNNVIQPVVPFIETNIQHENWRNREAAVMAFGSILDGPDPIVLTPLVDQVKAVVNDGIYIDTNIYIFI